MTTPSPLWLLATLVAPTRRFARIAMGRLEALGRIVIGIPAAFLFALYLPVIAPFVVMYATAKKVRRIEPPPPEEGGA